MQKKNTFCKKRHPYTCLLIFMLSFHISYGQILLDGYFDEKGSGSIVGSYLYKKYDRFYFGKDLTDGNPANLGRISSNIVTLYGKYAFTDWLAGVVNLPYISIKSETGEKDPVLGENKVSALQDLSIFAQAKAYSRKFDTFKMNIAAGLGVTFPASDYDPRGVLSIGNKATAVDGVLIANFSFYNGLFIEAAGGYSIRNNSDFDIPNASLWKFKLGYSHRFFYLYTGLGIQNSIGGIDIGSPEFVEGGGLEIIPETQVDYVSFDVSLYVPVYKGLGVNGNYGIIADGRNIGKSDYVGGSLIYKF